MFICNLVPVCRIGNVQCIVYLTLGYIRRYPAVNQKPLLIVFRLRDVLYTCSWILVPAFLAEFTVWAFNVLKPFKPYQSYYVPTCTAFHSAVVSVYEQKMLIKPVSLFITTIITGVKSLSLLLAKIMFAVLIQKYLKPLNFINFEKCYRKHVCSGNFKLYWKGKIRIIHVFVAVIRSKAILF